MRKTLLLCLLPALLIAAAPARAADTKINFSIVLHDYDDNAYTDCVKVSEPPAAPTCLKKVDYTLGRLAVGVLNTIEPGARIEDIRRRGELIEKLRGEGEVTMSEADLSMLRSAVEKRAVPTQNTPGLPTTMVYRALRLLGDTPK